MSDYPIRFESDYGEQRSRVSTFFRLVLLFPHMVVLSLYAIAAYVVVIVAWFALLITGRWPSGMYSFTAQFLRYVTHVNGYMLLLTDAYPPFGARDDYPVRLTVAPPQESYSRLKVLGRALYVIPAYFIQMALLIVAQVLAFIAWFAIVFTGRQPRAFQDLIVLGTSYWARSTGLFLLLTETYPPIQEQPALTGGPERPAGLPG